MTEFTTSTPAIFEYPDRRILQVTRRGWVDGAYMRAAIEGADTLFGFLDEHDVPYIAGTYMGITPDNPMLMDPAECRYITAVVVDAGTLVPASADVEESVLSGGREATVLHTGPLEYLGNSWLKLIQWREEQGLQQRAPAYEVYVDDPPTTPPAEQRMELRIPVY